MPIQPYLHFDGNCEEALNYYKQHLGAQIDMLMHYSESPVPMDPNCIKPEMGNRVMHASFRLGDSVIMASDWPDAGHDFESFSLTYTVNTEAEADKIFNALADGGKVVMPLGKTFYSPRFGMLSDRFGVHWMVMVPAKEELQATA